MLKKGQAVKPSSSMGIALALVEQGVCYQREIVKQSGLNRGAARSAIWNLTHINLIKKTKDQNGRLMYVAPQSVGMVADCLKGVSSIFGVGKPFTTCNN